MPNLLNLVLPIIQYFHCPPYIFYHLNYASLFQIHYDIIIPIINFTLILIIIVHKAINWSKALKFKILLNLSNQYLLKYLN